MVHRNLKIGIVGCGALGSYYGACLVRAGHEVHFLLRTDYATVHRSGVLIRSFAGDFRVFPKCAWQPEEIGPCDLVVIGLKTTANREFSRLLPPLIGPTTLLLTLQNGLGNEEQLTSVASPEQIFGGLCFVCLNRVQPGVIHHIDHGNIVLGAFVSHAGGSARQLASYFEVAGVPCAVTDNLAQAHWEKLVWNIPFNGLGVAGSAGYEAVVGRQSQVGPSLRGCLTTDLLLQDPRWLALVRELMQEVIRAAQALGFALPDQLADEMIQRTGSMGPYKASTLIDYERRQPLEIESLFREPWRRARRAGVPTPRLAALCRLLEKMDPGRQAIGD